MKKFQKLGTRLLATIAVCGGLVTSATPVCAKTVYYKGSAVEWDYGRTAGLWGWSHVQSGTYTHGTTVNGKWSGWQSPGIMASVSKFIGNEKLQVYWSCK